MSKSYDLLVEAAVEALRSYVLPGTIDEFARGYLFSVIFALNVLKSAGDWRHALLHRQVKIQNAAYQTVESLAPDWLIAPKGRQHPYDACDIALTEALRNDGDKSTGTMLMMLADDQNRLSVAHAFEIERVLRQAVRDKLTIETALVPKSMLNEIATRKEA